MLTALLLLIHCYLTYSLFLTPLPLASLLFIHFSSHRYLLHRFCSFTFPHTGHPSYKLNVFPSVLLDIIATIHLFSISMSNRLATIIDFLNRCILLLHRGSVCMGLLTAPSLSGQTKPLWQELRQNRFGQRRQTPYKLRDGGEWRKPQPKLRQSKFLFHNLLHFFV